MSRVNWREWSDEAFEECKRTGKPVLLDISAVWCHWCLVMEETTYSDDKVIEKINSAFVPIRVDSDRNPDLNLRYNLGGWPTTVFLTSERDIISGATYVPPHQMLALLERVAGACAEQGEGLVSKARQLGRDRVLALGARPGSARLTDFEDILDTVRAAFDPQFGGFGFDHKFPHANALELLMFNYERSGEEQDLEIIARTLEAMINGEIFDHAEGGVFRYATRRDWTAPHYEKLLDDNAKIASVLLDAYRIDHRMEFLDLARSVFSYAENVLMSFETGAFFESQDADEDYYKLDRAGRGQHGAPSVDAAVFTGSNAEMSMAYLKLWAATGEEAARKQALRIVDFLNLLPRSEDGTVCHYFENHEARGFGNLSDQSMLVLANAACYGATGTENYLDLAVKFADSLIDAFGSDTGAFYDISAERAAARGLSRYAAPLDDSAAAARGLLKMVDLTGNADYRAAASRALDAFAVAYANSGIMASGYGIAVALANLEPVVVTVNGAAGEPGIDRLIQVSMESCGCRCTVNPSCRDDEPEPTATVCIGPVCFAKVTDPVALADELAQAVSGSGL